MKVAVIGAGIAGITAAYVLSKNKYSVEVFEQESFAAMKTSYANGGQISASNSEVWNTWQNVLNGLKWVLKKDAPLYIKPSLELDKLTWLTKFLYHTVKNDYLTNTIKTIQLSVDSRALLEQIILEEQLEFDYKKCGILHFYKDNKYFNKSKNVQNLYETNKCQWKIVNPNEILEIDNSLQYIENLIGGAWTSDDSVGDIHKFCNSLSKVLIEKYNTKFHFDCAITNIDSIVNEFDLVIIANGVGAKKLSEQAGDNLSIYPVKGYSITIHNNQQENLPRVSLLDDRSKIVTSTLGNRFRVAGTAELTGENYDISRSRIDPLIKWTKQNFPQISTKDYSQWACLRPMTPNMMPIVKQGRFYKKIFYHTGHGHLGWTLSLATANLLLSEIKKYER